MRKHVILLVATALLLCPLVGQDKDSDSPKMVYIVSLKGEIFEGLAIRVKQKLRQIDTKKAQAIILEIDTPGGAVISVEEICRELDILGEEHIPIYAYIVGKAWSGGALVALACDQIYMKKATSIGSAQVKILTPFGVKDADEKTLSAMRANFRKYAQNRSYSPALAEAMVDPRLEVWEIIYRGEHLFKTDEELVKMESADDAQRFPIIKKGKVVNKGELANFTEQEAVKYSFCTAIHEKREDLLKALKLDEYPLKELDITASDAVANFLGNQWVRTILIALGILGLLIEFWTPGFGAPGIIGLVCFTLAFFGGYMAELAEIWEILLFIAGVILLLVEIFLLPGFGVAGVLGIIFCFLGLLLSFQNFVLPENETQVSIFTTNVFNIFLSIGIDIAVFTLISRLLPEDAPLRHLSVGTVQKAEEGYTIEIAGYSALLGKEGVAFTTLRPSGRAEIEGEMYNVEASGQFVEAKTPVKVIKVEGNRIVVEQMS